MKASKGIRSGDIQDPQALLQAVMALPPAPYIPVERKDFLPEEGREIDMNHAGLTDARSSAPMLGTFGLMTCMGVAAFNPATGTGGVAHLAQGEDCVSLSKDSKKALEAMLSGMRSDSSQLIEVRMSGPYSAGGIEDTFIKNVLEVLNHTQNVTILSADFKGKVFPSAVGLDTRRWEQGLLKGNKTIGSMQTASPDELREGMKHVVPVSEMPSAPAYDDNGLFDGRSTFLSRATNSKAAPQRGV